VNSGYERAGSGSDRAARVSVVASIGYFTKLAEAPAIGVLGEAVGLLNAFSLIVGLFIVAFAGSLRPAAPSDGSASMARIATLAVRALWAINWCGTINELYTTYPLRTGVSHGQSALRAL
jgi:hypothetical protein